MTQREQSLFLKLKIERANNEQLKTRNCQLVHTNKELKAKLAELDRRDKKRQ